MKETPAIYLGKIVSKQNFRAFIYSLKGEKKLVKSWDEFESYMQSGLWVAEPQKEVNLITENELINNEHEKNNYKQKTENKKNKSQKKKMKQDDQRDDGIIIV